VKALWKVLAKVMAKNPMIIATLCLVLLGAVLALCAFRYQLKVIWKDGQLELKPAVVAADAVPAEKK